MARGFNPTALIPAGVVMESVDDTGPMVVITVRSSMSVGKVTSLERDLAIRTGSTGVLS